MDNSILEKIKSYCAYQERSHKEVRTKLLSMEIYGDDLERYILNLPESILKYNVLNLWR
jgi:regulatory protein